MQMSKSTINLSNCDFLNIWRNYTLQTKYLLKGMNKLTHIIPKYYLQETGKILLILVSD